MAFSSEKGRQGAAGVSTGGFDIDNSLRFNDNDSATLSKTLSSSGNRKTWTFSGWVKRGNLATGSHQRILGTTYEASSDVALHWRSNDSLEFQNYEAGGGSNNWSLRTTALFRDTSAWYHIVFCFDSTQSTSSDRYKMYVNGTRITDFAVEQYPTLNTNGVWNWNTRTHYVGSGPSTQYLDGYLAEVHFIDGTALDPTSFGETGDYGEWKAKKVSGLTYGTNGFYLDFKTSGTLGNDAAGSNNWTTNNLASTDQMVDTPTNNFATLNPLQINSAITYSEGNLKAYRSAGDNAQSFGSIQVTSGKWYAEFYCVSQTTLRCQIGVQINDKVSASNRALGQDGYSYRAYNGNKSNNGTESSYASTYTDGDIIGVALDADNGDVTFYKNGTSLGEAFSGISADSFKIGTSGEDGWAIVANFGQDSSFAGNKTAQGNQDGNEIGDFYYTPPSGFLALCTSNLPDPAVIPSEHFNALTYTGTGTTNVIPLDGMTAADMWWDKYTGGAGAHQIFDRVRGLDKVMFPNLTNGDQTISGTAYSSSSGNITYTGTHNGKKPDGGV